MTKKDFILIAKTIRSLGSTPPLVADGLRMTMIEHVANAFADALATTNLRFDRGKFIQACGVFE